MARGRAQAVQAGASATHQSRASSTTLAAISNRFCSRGQGAPALAQRSQCGFQGVFCFMA
jgi:hypothetical protein